MLNYIVPVAKRIDADMLEFAAPEIGEVISGRKTFKTAAKSGLNSAGKQNLKKNNWLKRAAGGSEVVNWGESFQQNLQNNPVGREKSFSQTILVDHIKQQFSVPSFCGIIWKSWMNSPNCWRCLIRSWTRNLFNYLNWWKLYRVWISNGSELLRWFETVFFGIEAQICQKTWLRYKQGSGKKSTKMSLLFLMKQVMTKKKK